MPGPDEPRGRPDRDDRLLTHEDRLTALGARRPERAARERRAPRRPSSGVYWRRRLLASLIVIALGAAVWYVFLNRRSTDFAGTWAGSQALLGSTTLVIRDDGDGFRIKGLEIDGQKATDIHVDDGRLFASGQAAGRTWSVRFELQAEDRQLWAVYDPGDGSEEQRLRFTRVPD